MAQQIKNVLTAEEIKVLLDYLKIDDDRTDQRPDIRSKHPRWNIDVWPQSIIQSVLDKLTARSYVVDDVTFHDSKIGLKPHTDYGSVNGVDGLTCLFTLHAEPVSQTVYFKNVWTLNTDPTTGAFFTRVPWTPYSYKLENKHGEMTNVTDLRELLTQCIESPDTVTEFDVDDNFINLIQTTVHKRSLPYLPKENQDKISGYQQPAPRRHDYETLTHFDPMLKFDQEIHQKYLSHVPLEDLHGLTVESILEWEPGSVIVHSRDQLHASSSQHSRKIFLTVFYHEV
jgi:hypothetical protein